MKKIWEQTGPKNSPSIRSRVGDRQSASRVLIGSASINTQVIIAPLWVGVKTRRAFLVYKSCSLGYQHTHQDGKIAIGTCHDGDHCAVDSQLAEIATRAQDDYHEGSNMLANCTQKCMHATLQDLHSNERRPYSYDYLASTTRQCQQPPSTTSTTRQHQQPSSTTSTTRCCGVDYFDYMSRLEN